MSDKSKQQYIDFEAYEREAEPHKRERAFFWVELFVIDALKKLSWHCHFLKNGCKDSANRTQ